MDFFRVISPNNLRLSSEECKAYLTGEEDPTLPVVRSNEQDSSDGWDLTDLKLWVIQDAIHLVTNRLLDNFELMEGQSIARADMYTLFRDFCQNSGLSLCNQALFGKTVRNAFPQIKTRRIGIRKHSRYHYTGICPKLISNISEQLLLIKKTNAVKEMQDPLYNQASVTQDHSAMCKNLEGSLLDPKKGSDHLLTTLLPNFPTITTVCVTEDVQEETAMMLSLYRYLALDILTAVMKTQFIKLQEIVSVFWRNVPNSIYRCLTKESVMGVIVTCDRQIYSAMTGLLVPNFLINMPKSMIDLLMENFGRHFQHMMEKSLHACPYILKHRKMQETRRFCSRLSHRLSLCRLCGQVQDILSCEEKVRDLNSHISKLDIADIVAATKFVFDEAKEEGFQNRIMSGIQQFQQMLQRNASFDSYTRWIKTMFKQNTSRSIYKKGDNYQGMARVTILELSYIAALIARELRASKALPNIQITFHMLEMFFISYLRYLLDVEFGEEKVARSCPRNNHPPVDKPGT